jgi:hypothetical protein
MTPETPIERVKMVPKKMKKNEPAAPLVKSIMLIYSGRVTLTLAFDS